MDSKATEKKCRYVSNVKMSNVAGLLKYVNMCRKIELS